MLNFSTDPNIPVYLNALKQFSFEEIFNRNRMQPTEHKTREMVCVEALLTIPVPLDATDKNGVTLLMWASAHGHCEIVDLLLKQGANPELHDFDGETALMKASCFGQLGVMKLLLENKVDIESVDNDGHTALALTIYLYTSTADPSLQAKYHSVTKMLLDHGANAQVTYLMGGRKYSLLNFASRNGAIDIATLLIDNLKQKDDIDLFEDEFIFAVNVSFSHAVRNMLAIKPALLDRHQDCVYRAIVNLNYELVIELLEAATPMQRQNLFNYRDQFGNTPLLMAFRMQKFGVVRNLLNYGDDLGKLLLFARANEQFELLLKEEPWFPMLQEYAKKVTKHEATPTLTEKAADVVFHEAKKTGTNLKDLQLPRELSELCFKSPERLELYSRYRLSSQTRELLASGSFALLNITELAAKRRRI